MQLNQQANGTGARTDAVTGRAGVLRRRPEKRCRRAIRTWSVRQGAPERPGGRNGGCRRCCGAGASGCGGRSRRTERRGRPGSVVAQADPTTPMPVTESSAAQRCKTVNGNPSTDGVIEAMYSLDNGGLDDKDAALTPITAIHRVRPQYETLAMGIIGPIAAGKDCRRSS